MLFKYYFCYGSLPLLAVVGHIFGFICFFVGDSGLPRWIKLCAFGIFHELFFFFLIIIISVFLYLYLLVIKPFNLFSKYSLSMLWPATVLCSGRTAHKT